MTRHEIQILRAVGMAETAVARRTRTSVRSVRRIAHEPPVTTGETAELIATRQVGRPSTTAEWAATIQAWLVNGRPRRAIQGHPSRASASSDRALVMSGKG